MKRGTTLPRNSPLDISNYSDLHPTDPQNCRRSVRQQGGPAGGASQDDAAIDRAVPEIASHKIEAQLKAEVADLMAKAETADAADIPDGLSIPEELARREERLAKLAEARAKIEARAKERYARELAAHEAKLAARATKTAATGKKPGGRPPQPPAEGPRPDDQINLTDEARTMAWNIKRMFVLNSAWQGPGAVRQEPKRPD
jgi:hypothetical protein